MQENRARTQDPVAVHLHVCGVYPPVSNEPVLQRLVRDLLDLLRHDRDIELPADAENGWIDGGLTTHPAR